VSVLLRASGRLKSDRPRSRFRYGSLRADDGRRSDTSRHHFGATPSSLVVSIATIVPFWAVARIRSQPFFPRRFSPEDCSTRASPCDAFGLFPLTDGPLLSPSHDVSQSLENLVLLNGTATVSSPEGMNALQSTPPLRKR